jgi:hypothetical protein
MASAIVVYFMVVSFVVYVGDNRTLTIKFFFSAIEAARETQLLPMQGWTRPPQLAALSRDRESWLYSSISSGGNFETRCGQLRSTIPRISGSIASMVSNCSICCRMASSSSGSSGRP